MTFSTASRGVYAIATTPFLEDGSIDFASIDRLTDFYEQSGCTGITILGIMGEAPKLEPEESRAIVKRVVSRAKVPVIVGVSAPGFAAKVGVPRDPNAPPRQQRQAKPFGQPRSKRGGAGGFAGKAGGNVAGRSGNGPGKGGGRKRGPSGKGRQPG